MMVEEEKTHYTQYEAHQHQVQVREASGILFFGFAMKRVSYTSVLISGDMR